MNFFASFTAAVIVIKIAISFFSRIGRDAKVREIKYILNAKHQKLHLAKTSNKDSLGEIQRVQRGIEYIIRGKVAEYYQSQIDYIDALIELIRDTQNEVYLSLQTIQGNVERSLNYLPNSTRSEITYLHGQIAESKKIKSDLIEARDQLLDDKHRLINKNHPDYIHHNSLGGKTLVKKLIEQQKQEALSAYSAPAEIELGELTVALEHQCPECSSYLGGWMTFCFLCGTEFQGKKIPKVRWKKVAKTITCKSCKCYLREDWQHCPNCGVSCDTHELKALLNLKAV